jgi:transglutaminase-like putative cysteine protease
MRLEIRYVTDFQYPGRVRESHNLLRARPATDAHQRLVSYRATVQPTARVFSYVDYWGTWVDAFGVRRPHERLIIVADSVVEVAERPGPEAPFPMATYGGEEVRTVNWAYLQPSRHAGFGAATEALMRDAVAGTDGDGLAAVFAIHHAVQRALEYTQGATYVGMDLAEVVAAGKGVCQDYAHLALAMYRMAGIPARYVSGYLYAEDQSVGTVPDDAEIDVQTHAWVEVLVPGWGWWGIDPTNATAVSSRHAKIGHGRDYDDVMPLRGTYHGNPDHALDVKVRISRETITAYQQAQAQQ